MKHIFETPHDGNYYFGYYDKSPINRDSTKILAMRTKFIDRIPDKNDLAEIGYFYLNSTEKKFVKIGSTKTFNWQQGAMLHWFGDRNNKVIFNDIRNNSFVSVIVDIKTNKETILPMAIYSLSSDSKFAICADNERLHWCRRGYSYDGISNERKNKHIVPEESIYKLDTDSKELKEIININTVLNFKPISNMLGGIHYLEHMMISPSDKRFAFLHRWKIKGGGIYTRLFTVNIDGTELRLLNDSGRMSHFCWKDEETIFGWGGISNPINSLRQSSKLVKLFLKPLIPLYKIIVRGNADSGVSSLSSLVTGDSYIFIKDKTSKKYRVPVSVLDRDGHPTFNPIRIDIAITDTYPDQNNYQNLILFNSHENTFEIIDKIKTTPEYNFSPLRCDLHPKWSFDGNYVAVDTLINSKRGMRVYQIR